MKAFLKIFSLTLIIILSCAFAFFLYMNKATGKIPETGAEFEIVYGDTSYSVSKRLFDEGYINSRELFIMVPRALKLDKNLKVGWVKLKPNETTIEMVKEIYLHEYVTVSFTVPEGSTLSQIKKILIENDILTKEDVDGFFKSPDYKSELGLTDFKSVEGFFFPETYKFYKGVKAKNVFPGMTALFFKKLAEIYPDYKMMDSKALYDKIIMASIIEKEVKLKEEAPKVAGVFYNRLNKRMMLQSCATVQYVLDKPKEQLLETDLKIESPYNTYIHVGYPPTAISNPGYTALKSSFYPEKNNYLFFVVADPDKGQHHFSETYSEHLANQKIYKKIKGFY